MEWEASVRALPGITIGLAVSAVMAFGVAGTAAAQSSSQNSSQDGFTTASPVAVNVPLQHWDDGLKTPSLVGASLDPSGAGFGPLQALGPNGQVAWATRETWFEGRDGSIDRISVSQGGPVLGGGGAPVWFDPGRAAVQDRSYDINYTRGWPGALKVASGRYAMDVTPHAGVGTTSLGQSAEFGATVHIGAAEGLERLGVHQGSNFGQRGRWYLYAEASGRAIGYNFLRGDTGWRRSGLSTDQGAFIGDQQAGVAWRKGDMQASFGYVQRSIQIRNMRLEDLDIDSHESMVALSFSFKPSR
jgi:hypothetical protein